MGSVETKKIFKPLQMIQLAGYTFLLFLFAACGGGDGSSSPPVNNTGTDISVVSQLSGLEVVPTVNSRGSGEASLTINDLTGVITGSLSVFALEGTVTLAHIHDGSVGSNGGVLVTLEQDPNRPNVFTIPANTSLSSTDTNKLLTGQTYWQIHSSANPTGELRAQILPDNIELSRISIPLSGEEISNAVNTNGSGQGVLIVNTSTGAIAGALSTRDLQGVATAGHLHSGAPGVAGGILVTLEQDANDTNVFTIPANTMLAAADLTTLMDSNSYLQVHTAAHTTGEVRGQVLPAASPFSRIVTPLSGEEVIAAINTTASGRAVLLVNNTTGDLSGAMTARNLQGTATAGHIHDGAAGSNGGIILAFDQDATDPTIFSVPDNTTLDSANLARVLASNSYLQIHSDVNTTGELRGQILAANSDIQRITVPLSGEEVVDAVNTSGSGQGVLLVNTTSGALYGAVSTRNLLGNASAGHIHNGAAGTNGGIMLVLEQDTNDINLFSVPVGTSLNPTDLATLLNSASYLQIHSSVVATGEVRGQVIAAGTSLVRVQATLTGGEVEPAVTTSATARSTLLIDTTTGDVTGGLVISDVTGAATVAHLHLGARATNGGIAIVMTQDPADTDLFQIPAATQLTGDDLNALLNTSTYLQVHSSGNPTGEVRAQVAVPAAQ